MSVRAGSRSSRRSRRRPVSLALTFGFCVVRHHRHPTTESLSSSSSTPSSHSPVRVEVQAIVGDVERPDGNEQSVLQVSPRPRPEQGAAVQWRAVVAVSAWSRCRRRRPACRTVSSPGRYRAVRAVVAASRRRCRCTTVRGLVVVRVAVDIRVGIAGIVDPIRIGRPRRRSHRSVG